MSIAVKSLVEKIGEDGLPTGKVVMIFNVGDQTFTSRDCWNHFRYKGISKFETWDIYPLGISKFETWDIYYYNKKFLKKKKDLKNVMKKLTLC